LELERESALHSLLPGADADDRLEASGVLALDEGSCLVVFDNLNRVAWIETTLEGPGRNHFVDAPSPGRGFEDIAFDSGTDRFFLLIESMKDAEGVRRGRIAEYDTRFAHQGCCWLPTAFESANRGFEGLEHVFREGREELWALCEGNLCRDAEEGGGRIQVFARAADRGWSWSHEVALPVEAGFADYSALAIRGGRVAIVSQRSARLWVGRLDGTGRGLEAGGQVYRFPGAGYCNVEGIAWLGSDRLLAVSDRKKRSQRGRCARKQQSIHVLRLPAHRSA
jgi:hypothetical protein